MKRNAEFEYGKKLQIAYKDTKFERLKREREERARENDLRRMRVKAREAKEESDRLNNRKTMSEKRAENYLNFRVQKERSRLREVVGDHSVVIKV